MLPKVCISDNYFIKYQTNFLPQFPLETSAECYCLPTEKALQCQKRDRAAFELIKSFLIIHKSLLPKTLLQMFNKQPKLNNINLFLFHTKRYLYYKSLILPQKLLNAN